MNSRRTTRGGGLASSILKAADPKMPVAEVTQDGVTISILSADGQIHTKENALQIKFKDPGGHPVAAENVKVELNMPGMVMHSGAKIHCNGSRFLVFVVRVYSIPTLPE